MLLTVFSMILLLFKVIKQTLYKKSPYTFFVATGHGWKRGF